MLSVGCRRAELHWPFLLCGNRARAPHSGMWSPSFQALPASSFHLLPGARGCLQNLSQMLCPPWYQGLVEDGGGLWVFELEVCMCACGGGPWGDPGFQAGPCKYAHCPSQELYVASSTEHLRNAFLRAVGGSLQTFPHPLKYCSLS